MPPSGSLTCMEYGFILGGFGSLWNLGPFGFHAINRNELSWVFRVLGLGVLESLQRCGFVDLGLCNKTFLAKAVFGWSPSAGHLWPRTSSSKDVFGQRRLRPKTSSAKTFSARMSSARSSSAKTSSAKATHDPEYCGVHLLRLITSLALGKP